MAISTALTTSCKVLPCVWLTMWRYPFLGIRHLFMIARRSDKGFSISDTPFKNTISNATMHGRADFSVGWAARQRGEEREKKGFEVKKEHTNQVWFND